MLIESAAVSVVATAVPAIVGRNVLLLLSFRTLWLLLLLLVDVAAVVAVAVAVAE